MLQKIKRAVQDAAIIVLYIVIALAVFAAVVLSTLANLGFRWGPGA